MSRSPMLLSSSIISSIVTPQIRLLFGGRGSKCCRQFHDTSRMAAAASAASPSSVEKSGLAKLRKTTGYSFSKCKEALEKHNNDLKAAEKWLRAEAQTHGWEKASKLQGRATAQGLISILASPQNAVMLEVNCETDFVARNKKFQALVQKVTQACFVVSQEANNNNSSNIFKHPLNHDELCNIPIRGERQQQHLIKDEIALTIGEIGENIRPRRGLSLQAGESIMLSGYTHPASPEAEKQRLVQFGKFGAIVAYKVLKADVAKNSVRVAEIGRQLCQHIVGMNPLEIGSMDEPPPKRKPVQEPQKLTPPPPSPTEDQDVVDELDILSSMPTGSEPEVDEERVLLNQEFLLDPGFTVREFLIQNSVEIVEFVRFECGENVESQ